MYDQPRCSEVGIAESRAISLSTARVAMLDKKAIGFGLFSCIAVQAVREPYGRAKRRVDPRRKSEGDPLLTSIAAYFGN